MKILALYPYLPYPSSSGSRLRGSLILEILSEENDVVFASLLGRGDVPSQLLSWSVYPRLAAVLTSSLDTAQELTDAGRSLRAMVSSPRAGMPESLQSFDTSEMWNQLATLDISELDVVHVRYMYMAPYALALKRANPHLRLVVDIDDIVSVVFGRQLRMPKRLSELRGSLWSVKELIRIYCFETGPLRGFDSVWVCSQRDKRKLSLRVGSSRIAVVENAVDSAKLSGITSGQSDQILVFVADFNYGPNKEGAEFVVRNVWPRVLESCPGAQLWLVGRNNCRELLELNGHNGITVTGRVDDVNPYLQKAMISIAPILMGAGTRIKILEALGAGLPVVSTKIGAEGIEAQDGVHLMIADGAKQFAGRCIRLLQDKGLRSRLAKEGRALIRDKYDVLKVKQSVKTCYERLNSLPNAPR